MLGAAVVVPVHGQRDEHRIVVLNAAESGGGNLAIVVTDNDNSLRGAPRVTLGGTALVVTSSNTTRSGRETVGVITAKLPTGVAPGSYDLSVRWGHESDSTFAVTIGRVGPMGPVGPVGPQGPIGATGAQGPKGDVGAVGPTGPVGAVGPQGPAGETGATGAQGEKGDTGAVGPQGPQGEKGDTGATGPTGASGPAGPQGDKGETGATGATGATGTVGPQGDKGDAGAAGPQGPQGPQGDRGAAGETGPVGPVGPKGDKGDVGEPGAVGPKGDKGDPGEPADISAFDATIAALQAQIALLQQQLQQVTTRVDGLTGPPLAGRLISLSGDPLARIVEVRDPSSMNVLTSWPASNPNYVAYAVAAANNRVVVGERHPRRRNSDPDHLRVFDGIGTLVKEIILDVNTVTGADQVGISADGSTVYWEANSAIWQYNLLTDEMWPIYSRDAHLAAFQVAGPYLFVLENTFDETGNHINLQRINRASLAVELVHSSEGGLQAVASASSPNLVDFAVGVIDGAGLHTRRSIRASVSTGTVAHHDFPAPPDLALLGDSYGSGVAFVPGAASPFIFSAVTDGTTTNFTSLGLPTEAAGEWSSLSTSALLNGGSATDNVSRLWTGSTDADGNPVLVQVDTTTGAVSTLIVPSPIVASVFARIQ